MRIPLPQKKQEKGILLVFPLTKIFFLRITSMFSFRLILSPFRIFENTPYWKEALAAVVSIIICRHMPAKNAIQAYAGIYLKMYKQDGICLHIFKCRCRRMPAYAPSCVFMRTNADICRHMRVIVEKYNSFALKKQGQRNQ